MIDRVPREKALQATAEEKVSHGQQAMHNGAIAEANSQAVDLAAFNAKEAIKGALALMEESYHIAEDLDRTPARRIPRRLRRVKRSLQGA